MPALFAYLIALGVLLGGGYGALSWLAAPEPVKMVAKAKSPVHRPVIAESNSRVTPEASSAANEVTSREPQISASDHAAANPNERAANSNAQPLTTATAESEKMQVAAPAQAQPVPPVDVQVRSANAEVSTAEVKEQGKPSAGAVSAGSTGKRKIAASTTSASSTRTARRPHGGHPGNRAEKPRLALMTLRTIDFPDGRRVTQLLPYRDSKRALAFDPDD